MSLAPLHLNSKSISGDAAAAVAAATAAADVENPAAAGAAAPSGQRDLLWLIAFGLLFRIISWWLIAFWLWLIAFAFDGHVRDQVAAAEIFAVYVVRGSDGILVVRERGERVDLPGLKFAQYLCACHFSVPPQKLVNFP